jgi:hypothetical protein
LNFERPHNQDPSRAQIVLAGRIGGELIGYSGIHDVLLSLMSSLTDKIVSCTKRHEQPAHALICRPSTWLKKRPMHSSLQHHTYISVKDDKYWTIFLAGQVASIEGRICFGCFDCTLAKIQHEGRQLSKDDTEEDYPTVYIGYN